MASNLATLQSWRTLTGGSPVSLVIADITKALALVLELLVLPKKAVCKRGGHFRSTWMSLILVCSLSQLTGRDGLRGTRTTLMIPDGDCSGRKLSERVPKSQYLAMSKMTKRLVWWYTIEQPMVDATVGWICSHSRLKTRDGVSGRTPNCGQIP